jgi:serine phosphatase RsbU (regulator of sigma subunit)
VLATLQVLEGRDKGRQYDLAEDEIVLGRQPHCHIVLDDGMVGRRHARLVAADDTYAVEDLGSRNGTYVNGKLVRGQVPLRDKDEIRTGHTLLLFRVLVPVARGKDDDDSSRILGSFSALSSTEVFAQVSVERRLQAILQITRALGRTLNLGAVLSSILEGLFDIFPQADRGLVLLREGSDLVLKATTQRYQHEGPIEYSNTIVAQVLRAGQAILSEDATEDPLISVTESIDRLRIRSVMCVPLLSQDMKPLGVVQLDTQNERRKFRPEDIEVLASVAHTASLAVEYVGLHHEVLKKVRQDKELEFARAVQHSMLPHVMPSLEEYTFWAYYQASGMVGGDYYDFIRLPDNSLAVLLADVAGKGVPAALMMARASALCKVALLRHPDNVADALGAMNNELCDSDVEGAFVTLGLCTIHPTTHQVTVANAGHMSPIFLRHDGTIDESAGDKARGYPLGVVKGFQYTTCSTSLDCGDCVVLFSDGISEARNSAKQRYSIQRVRGHLAALGQKDPALIGHALLEDVDRHVGDADQDDDISLVVFGRNAR